MHMTPTKKQTKTTAPTLLWSERGQIGCTLPGHAPHEGSDTWRFEHWKKLPEGTLNEDGQPFACELCARGDRAPAEPAAGEQPVEAETLVAGASEAGEGGTEPQTTEAPPAPERKKGKKTKADLTLADLAERYVAHLEQEGKSAGTSASYGLELKTALSELGADTKLADLTPEMVALYFASKRVTKKKNGKHKSPLSIAKTQRVLRLALVWAVEKKLIEKAPLPEELATH
jgi:hypothetical protein